jgi:ribosomal protein S18 acetylase RimI-like enzyme
VLTPFRPEHGPEIVGWVRGVDEASAWAALDHVPTLDDLARWHADSEVIPFAFVDGTRVVGYGEIWEDHEESEAELARLVVAPASRGQGHGRSLTRALADEAHRRGFADVWLRVVPDNAPARRAYEAAGFQRATPAEEAAFNTGQHRDYAWMRDSRRTPIPGQT